MKQLTLDLDVHETRQARADRIALLLQETDRVQRASTYFTEANQRRAEAIAAADEGRPQPCGANTTKASPSVPKKTQ